MQGKSLRSPIFRSRMDTSAASNVQLMTVTEQNCEKLPEELER